MAILYEVSFADGKKYIGASTLSLKARMRCHRRAARSGSTQLVHKHMMKFGVQNLKARVLVIGEEAFVLEAEEKAISKFSTQAPHGLNIQAGGRRPKGFKHTQETRLVISEKKKGVKRPDLSARNKERAGLPGHKHTDEFKSACGVWMKEYWASRRVLKGKS